jgi:hypothetical protein
VCAGNHGIAVCGELRAIEVGVRVKEHHRFERAKRTTYFFCLRPD